MNYLRIYKLIILKKFNALQENTNKQLNETRKTTHEQKESITNDQKKTGKKNQMEIWGLKNIIITLKTH